MFKGRQINSRIFIVVSVFFLLWGVLLFRSAYLQLIPHKKLSELQSRLFDRTVTLKPRRGLIYDRNGKALALSIPSSSLFADPQKADKPYWTARKLARLFNKPHKPILKKLLNKKRRFVWLKRHLSEKEIQQIRSWNIKGLYFLKESKRFYTNGPSLSQVLGFTGIEGQGLEGIEKQYDEALKGKAQKILLQRDARGRPLFMDFSPFAEQVSGFDLYLTIDSDLQFYLERELAQAIRKSKAKSAVGVILSAKNSEVWAMANVPNYNPNNPFKGDGFSRRNRTLTDIFEPGSALKTFTIISALQKGLSPSKLYANRGGKLQVGNSVIREAEPDKKFKPFLNLSEILAFSSNVGSASLALDVGAQKLRETFLKFGFGEKTGIDFPGEAGGLLRALPWRPIETATISFGHGIAGTALQVANAYGAIANGGTLMKPFLAKSLRNPYTGEEKVFKGRAIHKALDVKTARILTLMLISVTEKSGTGSQAVVPGYFVAGKTGTAQKVDPKNKTYKKGEYITSFAGFIPAHKPEFVIYVAIDGTTENFYASSLTAPLFSRIASYSVRRAGLSPTVLKEGNIMAEGMSRSQKTTQKRTAGLLPEEQPASSVSMTSLQKTGPLAERLPAWTNDRVPDLTGLTLREALNKTHKKGLKLKIQGSGQLVRSLPSAGEPLPENKQLTLIFN